MMIVPLALMATTVVAAASAATVAVPTATVSIRAIARAMIIVLTPLATTIGASLMMGGLGRMRCGLGFATTFPSTASHLSLALDNVGIGAITHVSYVATFKEGLESVEIVLDLVILDGVLLLMGLWLPIEDLLCLLMCSWESMSDTEIPIIKVILPLQPTSDVILHRHGGWLAILQLADDKVTQLLDTSDLLKIVTLGILEGVSCPVSFRILGEDCLPAG